MSVLDPETVPLAGINLIEASAGTGKTYTLAELYCRLVTEKQLEVKQILVVTYTRAATEELRGRLRKRLVDERQNLLKKGLGQTEHFNRLQLAIQSFDEAAIYTIHGFCQRALQDFAFESGYSFDMEMISDEEEIKQAVVDDFWRRNIATADPEFSRFLLKHKQTPETLLSVVSGLPGKPYLTYVPLPEADPRESQHQAEADFIALKECWKKYSSEIIDIVTNSDLFKKNMYGDSVLGWLAALESMLNDTKLPDKLFEKFEKFTREKLVAGLKAKQVLPEHPFWAHAGQFFVSFENLQHSRQLQLQHCRLELARYLCDELPQRKRQQKVQAFDDLLINLQSALKSKLGEALSQQIRAQFQAALIDEFQDTDPVQYDCFRMIFGQSSCPVFYVGDPKQAIYSFRGADIFTYLKAKSAAQNKYNLKKNWRSHPLLVDAVNTLFYRDQIKDPFIYPDIPFHEVESAREQQPLLKLSGKMPPPLDFLWLESEDGKPLAVGELQKKAAFVTASQIAALVSGAMTGEVTLQNKTGEVRALNGGDIAVLVRSHKQGTLIQQALRQLGINSVQQSRDNVFQSEQAVMLEHVLLAIAQPNNDRKLATALATSLFEKTALEIYQLQQDDLAWLKQCDFFHHLHEIWLKSGFIVMFRTLMEQLNVTSRLLQLTDGERQLTNIMHLAELIQAHARRRNDAIEAILTWYAMERQASAANKESTQIRLESDEQLVKVITIHTSKGLEYPVVFCPFLWHQPQHNAKPTLRYFHREEDHAPCVAFGEPGFTEAELSSAEEERAEDMRLLYVALTRAKERCVLLWGPAKNVEKTGLFRLLHPMMDKVDPAEMRAELVSLTALHPKQMQFTPTDLLNLEPVAVSSEHAMALSPRHFDGKIEQPWLIGSFTGLSHGQHSEQSPDYDAEQTGTTSDPSSKECDRFSFIRGTNAGVCLHSLFEHWDFQSTGEEWQRLVIKTLNQFGIDTEKWAHIVSSWLQEVVRTPLSTDSALSLAQIEAKHRLDEMSFFFQVKHLSVEKLKKSLLPFKSEMPTLEPVLNQLDFVDLVGFMKGFIDLVFEFEGRFYIADYKSNLLGPSASHYDAAALQEAMIQHGYPLQYLIYSLALHRYLKLRVANYDPNRHFGGVYYLFIRGMKPEWGQTGVYFDRPSSALLDALDSCMRGDDD